MYPHTHFIFALIAALIGLKLDLINLYLAVVLVLFSVLLDIDHLLLYHSIKKDWNLKRCWNTCIAEDYKRERMVFHCIYFVILLIMISAILYLMKSSWSYVLVAGYFPHYFLDHLHLHLRRKKYKFSKIKIFGLIMHLHKFELLLDFLSLIVLILILLW